MLKDPDRNGNAERSANDEEEAALPLYIPAQRPEIGCLYANAAGHHQRHCLHGGQRMQQNGAGDCREREACQAGNKCAREGGCTKQETGCDVGHDCSFGDRLIRSSARAHLRSRGNQAISSIVI